jgi:hypothetical protein
MIRIKTVSQQFPLTSLTKILLFVNKKLFKFAGIGIYKQSRVPVSYSGLYIFT